MQKNQSVQLQGFATGIPTLAYSWNFGDNTSASGTLAPFKTYTRTGVYTVTLTVTDGLGRKASDRTTVTVIDPKTPPTNTAPTATFTGPSSVLEGGSATVSFTNQTDTTPNGAFRYSYDFNNDGVFEIIDSASASAAVPASFLGNGPANLVIRGQIEDQANAATNYTATINVQNVAPTATFGNGGAVQEHHAGLVKFTSVTDPSTVDVSAGFQYSYDFDNDGTFEIVNSANPQADVPGNFLDDNGSRVVRGRVIDQDGGFSDYTTSITVLNVAPTVSLTAPSSTTTAAVTNFSASVTDPSTADSQAGFTYSWNFGDGSTVTGAAVSHAYAVAGSYTVILIVGDKDGGTTTRQREVVVFDPTESGIQLSPGWATFGQVMPRGAAFNALQVGNLETQTDVKTRWDDGSIRFAVLTVDVPAANSYDVHPASNNAGTFQPNIPAALVRFDINGTEYNATLPNTPSFDTWISGPLAIEWRQTVIPTTIGGSEQAYLSVIFDTRIYRNGESHVDITVENSFDKAGATKIAYDVDIIVDGQQVYSHDNVIHWYLARWRKTFDVGLHKSQVRQDFEPYYSAKALPRYSPAVSNSSYTTAGPTFDILKRGGLSFDEMDQAGGRSELAPYPDWVAQYLVHRTSNQGEFVLANGDLAGSQPIHIRETNGNLVSIDLRPQFWLDPRGTEWVPLSDQPKGDLTDAARGPLRPDQQHQPSLAYVPYLLTGDRYYADEMKFWANFNLLSSQPSYVRNGAAGILAGTTVRAFAWSLRNLTDAAAYLPDDDAAKSYLVSKLLNNLHWADDYAAGRISTADWRVVDDSLGTSFALTSPTMPGYENKVIISQWQQNYLAWSLTHASDQGFSGGLNLRDRMALFQLRLFTSDPGYKREYGAPYYPTIGTYDSANNWTYFTSMSQMFEANYRNTDGSLMAPNDLVFYSRDARLSLLVGVQKGWTGAIEALDWLMSQAENSRIQDGFWVV